jgi:hypothetical protein
MVIVQLLMGELPERTVFELPEYRTALAPYLAITKAVRIGNLIEFKAVVNQHKVVFQVKLRAPRRGVCASPATARPMGCSPW